MDAEVLKDHRYQASAAQSEQGRRLGQARSRLSDTNRTWTGLGRPARRAGHENAGKIRPRRVWPGMRALLGGVLITLAVAGLWWSYTLSTATPSTQYIVAVSDITPGTVITSDHVGLQAIDLPTGVVTQVFDSSDDVEVLGSIAINFVSAGELVSVSDVRPAFTSDGANGTAVAGVASRYELSFEIELARALNGLLQPGELVDIIATNGTGASAATRRITTDAQVLSLAEIGEGGLGFGTVAVTLALASDKAVLEIVAAADQGVVTLVRAPLVRIEDITSTESSTDGGTTQQHAL